MEEKPLWSILTNISVPCIATDLPKHPSAHVHAACTVPWSATKISPQSFVVVESHTNWLLAAAKLQEETLYSNSDYRQ